MLFAKQRTEAISKYQQFVDAGVGKAIWSELKQQIFLGSDEFAGRLQRQIELPELLSEVPAVQKRGIAKPLVWYALQGSRNEAIQQAFASGGYSMAELSHYFCLHYGTISRIISGKSHKSLARARGKT